MKHKSLLFRPAQRRAIALPLAFTLALVGAAQADTRTWIQTASGSQSWNTTANWQDGLNTTAAGDTVNFTANLAGDQAIGMNSTRTVGTLNLGLSGNKFRYNFSNTGWILKANAGDTLGTATINVNNDLEGGDEHVLQSIVNMQVENVNLNINSAGGRLHFFRHFADSDGDGTRSPTMTLNAVEGALPFEFRTRQGEDTNQLRNGFGKLVVNQNAILVNRGRDHDSDGVFTDWSLGRELDEYLADAITLNGGTLRISSRSDNQGTHEISVNRGITLGALGGTLDATTTDHHWTVDSIITGTGGLTADGDGNKTLNAANDYTGATTVSAGTLILGASGSIANSSTIDVKSGATFDVSAVSGFTVGGSQTLTGGGTIKGATTINGILAPGASPGILTFENALTLVGSTVMEIDGNAGAGAIGGHDFVNLTGVGGDGELTYGGTMTLDIGTIFGVGTYSWDLFDFASETGGFTSISLDDQYSGSLTDAGGGVWGLTSGNNTWSFTESSGVLGLTVIPEPRAALLGGLGLLALLRRRRR